MAAGRAGAEDVTWLNVLVLVLRFRSVSETTLVAHADLTLGISLGYAYQSFLLPVRRVHLPVHIMDPRCASVGVPVVASWGFFGRFRALARGDTEVRGTSAALDLLVVSESLVSLFL